MVTEILPRVYTAASCSERPRAIERKTPEASRSTRGPVSRKGSERQKRVMHILLASHPAGDRGLSERRTCTLNKLAGKIKNISRPPGSAYRQKSSGELNPSTTVFGPGPVQRN